MDLKVVQDRQPLLGAGPLLVWLCNRAHSGAMVALDRLNDNLCLWRCIVVSRGAGIDRCTVVARALARGFGKEDNAGTLLNDLEQVEEFLNAGKPA